MVSRELEKAREYEKKFESDIALSERPVFHLTPRIGWMNDPNGFSYYKGQYHMFYQYYPYEPRWNLLHWGHAVSRDLLHWEYLPAAMAPDRPYDGDGCWSGSALPLGDGRHLLLYTGLQIRKEGDAVRKYQNQCLAVGDGLDYEKTVSNPVLDGGSLPEGFDPANFRDPKMFYKPDGTFGCVVAGRSKDDGGAALLFESENGFDWHFASVLDRSCSQAGRMWECPDFFELDGRQILMACIMDSRFSQGKFLPGVHDTLYFVGSYDENTKTFQRENVFNADYCTDYYAPQTVLAPDGRRICVGWVRNCDAGIVFGKNKWFGQLTLPRELTCRDGRVIQNPIRELEALHKNEISWQDVPVQNRTALDGVSGRVLDMTVDVRPRSEGGYGSFCMKVAADGEHDVVITYTPEDSVLLVGGGQSGKALADQERARCIVRSREGQIRLRVVLDRFSVEIFVNDGEQTVTLANCTPLSADGITFQSEGETLVSVKKYDLN